MTTFWATHQVGGPYDTLEASERALHERELLYPTLEELMPTNFPGKTILDYGCGPGHDTILFKSHGADHVTFADVSLQAMSTTAKRLHLHDLREGTHGVLIGSQQIDLLEVDYVHCAGVLQHTEDPMSILKDLRYVLKSDGEARFMVYDGDLSEHTKSEVPITTWWTHLQFRGLCHVAGFEAEYVGSYPCSAPWRPNCFAACYRCSPS